MPSITRLTIHLSGLMLTVAAVIAAEPARAAPMPPERTVYLARDLPDEHLIVLGASLAAWRPDSILLLDSSRASRYIESFLTAYKPAQVIPIGPDLPARAELERRFEVPVAPAVEWTHGPPLALWQSLFSRTNDVVVCPAQPRATLLQAACLAGALRAPLYVVRGRAGEEVRFARQLEQWHSRRVFLIGKAEKLAEQLHGVEQVRLSGETSVAATYQKQLALRKSIEIAVLANPADIVEDMGGMSALAPWIALRKHAALLLTNARGTNVPEVVERALRREALRQLDALLFVANLRAIPTWHRPNPIPGDKDQQIEMEPLTPEGNRPFTFATGRYFHEDRAVVTLMIARQTLQPETEGSHKALVASNSGNSLSLLETFSRNTIETLLDTGFETTALIGSKVSREELRKQMPAHGLFLWEGHSGTLMNDYEFPTWEDPLPPTFVFMQSCLSLTEARLGSLLSRGAFGVIGSSTRTYSGSGGACSLAFFNALLYEGQSVGDSLRQAKNFLLAYSLLKEKRLGDGATRTGANLRSAWAFTLWGDPTLRLPSPRQSAGSPPRRPFVRHEVHGNTIVVSLPDKAGNVVRTDKYQIALPPNGRFAGLVRKEKIDERRPLVPFVFAEVHLPRARPGLTPRLSSRLPSSRWVFCWDERRRCGYLLVTPRPQDTEELRFHVRWETVAVRNSPPSE
jgi:hypothetical protein